LEKLLEKLWLNELFSESGWRLEENMTERAKKGDDDGDVQLGFCWWLCYCENERERVVESQTERK
jgi:hypothetical protein